MLAESSCRLRSNWESADEPMAWAKKGMRTIAVDGTLYRWRFKAGFPDSDLLIQGTVSPGQQLWVTLRGWQDPWETISVIHVIKGGQGLAYLETNARNEPSTITPKFVRQAIVHALAHGWTPTRPAGRLALDYSDGAFLP